MKLMSSAWSEEEKHDLALHARDGWLAVATRAVELVRARGGTMTADQVHDALDDLGDSPAQRVLSQHIAAQGATVATLQAENERSRGILGTFDKRCADALADEVAVLVRRQVIDARSPAADALLDYRNPPSTERADRLATLQSERDAAQEAFKRAEQRADEAENGMDAACTERDSLKERVARWQDAAEKQRKRAERLRTVRDIIRERFKADPYQPIGTLAGILAEGD